MNTLWWTVGMVEDGSPQIASQAIYTSFLRVGASQLLIGTWVLLNGNHMNMIPSHS